MLDPVPTTQLDVVKPPFGTYRGRSGSTELGLSERGVSRIRQAISEKRWQWFAAFDANVAVGGAIVDAGFFGTAFLWVFDRQSGELVVDEDVVVPAPLLSVTTHPTVGTIARIDVPGRCLEMERTRDTFTVDSQFGGADLSLAFSPNDDQAITAICPVPDRHRGVNVTQKEPHVEVTGTVSIGDVAPGRSLDGYGFLDYSHGLLGRVTRWDWAFGAGPTRDGPPVAFNLVDHFNAGLENVVWVDGEPRSVAEATIEGDDTHWAARTACGTVDVTLAVEGSRRKDIDIGLIRSMYDQPLGRWTGTVAGYDIDGIGVAEEHLTRW